MVLKKLKSDSHLPKKLVLLASMKARGETCFLFHLKSSFNSQDISVFVLTFWSSRKSRLIRNMVDFKIYEITSWLTNNCNTHIRFPHKAILS